MIAQLVAAQRIARPARLNQLQTHIN